MNIIEMIDLVNNNRKEEVKHSILPEAAVMILCEAAVQYKAQLNGPLFKVGDWVTPLKSSSMIGPGRPHIVVEVRNTEADFNHGDPDSTSFGCRRDIRVLSISGHIAGVILAHWVESTSFEPWPADE